MGDPDISPSQLKEWFNKDRYRSIADGLSEVAPAFDRNHFLKLTTVGLDERSLMERLRQTSIAFEASLSGSYRSKVGVLRRFAPRIDHGFVGIFLSNYVAQFGLDDPEFSLEALREFTRFGSAEFAVRLFLVRDQEKTLATMLRWTKDRDEHVRRLSSEGCRPRLPWGLRLQSLVRDPSPLSPIIETLKDDESLYVRKSVANNLNDITKDHPDWVLSRLNGWNLEAPNSSWIAKRACRTLIKRGHPKALELFGFGNKPDVKVSFDLSPQRLTLGAVLTLDMRVVSTARTPQRLVVDYAIHYIKANGGSFPKVFKWSELNLAPGEAVHLTKRQVIRDFTTRTHYEGRHVVAVQINGKKLAEGIFHLSSK